MSEETRAQRILKRAMANGWTGQIVRERDAPARRGRSRTQHHDDRRKGRFPHPEELGPAVRIYDEAVFVAEEELRREDQARACGLMPEAA